MTFLRMDASRQTILFLVHSTDRSGAPLVVTRLAARVAATGRQVLVCFPQSGGMEKHARELGLETIVIPSRPGAVTRVGPLNALPQVLSRLRSLALIYRLCLRRDIQCVWVGSFVSAWAGLAAFLARRPVIYHIHEDLTASYFTCAPRIHRLRTAVVRRTSAAIALVTGRSARPLLPLRRGIRMTLLPNHVEPAPIDAAPRSAPLRAELGASRKDIVFLAFAPLLPHKGADTLVDAFGRFRERHPDSVLWIAGSEPDEGRDFAGRVRQLADKHGCRNAIRFLGFRADSPALLKSADAFVLSSRNEAQPLGVIEAMLASLPVIATNVGSVPRMVREGKTAFLVPKEDSPAMARAMARLADDPHMRSRMGQRGRRRAMRLFASDRDLQTVLDLIDTASGRRKRD